MNGVIVILCTLALVASVVAMIMTLRKRADSGEGAAALKTQIQGEMRYMTDMVTELQHTAAETQDRRLADLQRQMGNMSISSEQRLEAIRETMDKRIQGLQQENNRHLERMQETVNEKLQETLETRISKSFQVVSQRLEEVYKGLGEMKNLASGVDDLSKVLSNVKTRGILGEIQLGAILEQILAPEQYEENVQTRPGHSERVEFAVKLPGQGDCSLWLPIDAKFPGDTYYALQEAYESGDKLQIDVCGKQLENIIRKSAKDIHQKYVEPPYTTDFAIMFLPVEGLYAEVVRRGMVERLQREYKINIAGPTTMAALLNSLQMGFKTLQVQQQSSHVWEVLSSVKTEFSKFEEVLATTQKRMDQVNQELDKLVGVRTRSINRSLREIATTEAPEISTRSEEKNEDRQ